MHTGEGKLSHTKTAIAACLEWPVPFHCSHSYSEPTIWHPQQNRTHLLSMGRAANSMGWLLPVQQTRGTGHRLTAEVRRARTVTAHLHKLFWSHIYLQRFQQQQSSWTRSRRHATELRSPACSRTSITVPRGRQDVCSHLDTFSQGCRAERQNVHPAAFLAAVLCRLCPHPVISASLTCAGRQSREQVVAAEKQGTGRTANNTRPSTRPLFTKEK